MFEKPQLKNDIAQNNSRLVVTSYIIGSIFLPILFLDSPFGLCGKDSISILIKAVAAGGLAAGITGSIQWIAN